jgi:hypothetical protein
MSTDVSKVHAASIIREVARMVDNMPIVRFQVLTAASMKLSLLGYTAM